MLHFPELENTWMYYNRRNNIQREETFYWSMSIMCESIIKAHQYGGERTLLTREFCEN